jgi:homoserine kinase
MPIRVRVPASTSNLGPGFDCLGLALELFLDVSVTPAAAGLEVSVAGLDANQVPRGAENLVLAGLCKAMGRPQADPPAVRVRIDNGIPIGRGLGSSGAAIVAGLLAGTLLAGKKVDKPALLTVATGLEGHPDNVAPALFGGLVASASTDGEVYTVPLSLPAELELLLVVPDRTTPTHAARGLLPRTVAFAAATDNLAHTALLVGALARAEWSLLRPALRDRLHQEQRLALVPGLADALLALDGEPGCAGVALSGSGPTLLGFVRTSSPATGEAAVRVLAQHGVAARAERVRPQQSGAIWQCEGRP